MAPNQIRQARLSEKTDNNYSHKWELAYIMTDEIIGVHNLFVTGRNRNYF